MTKQETVKAVKLLQDRTDRTEVIGSDTAGGFALTAYWRDGGQRLFYTLDEVEHFLAVRAGQVAC